MSAFNNLDNSQLKKVGVLALCGLLAVGTLSVAFIAKQQKSLDSRSRASTGDTTVTNPTVTLQPIDDTYISTDVPSTNHGTEPKLLTERSSKSIKSESFIKYNLYSLLNKNIISVKLRTYVYDFTPSTSLNIRFLKDNSWGQESLTMSNQPSSFTDNLSPYIAVGTPTQKGLNSFDLSPNLGLSAFKTYQGSYLTIGTNILQDTGKIVLGSMESTLLPSYYPLLIVEYQNPTISPTPTITPLPNTLTVDKTYVEVTLNRANAIGGVVSGPGLKLTSTGATSFDLRQNTSTYGFNINSGGIPVGSTVDIPTYIYTSNPNGIYTKSLPIYYAKNGIWALSGITVTYKITLQDSSAPTPTASPISTPMITPTKTASLSPTVTVLNPNVSGLTWNLNSTYNVQWNVTYPTGSTANASNTEATVYLYKLNADSSLTAMGSITYDGTANAGTNQYSWLINNSHVLADQSYLPDITSGSKYVIEVLLMDKANPNTIRYGTDKSDNPFIIQ